MLSSPLIKIFIILGLINYSDEFNVGTNNLLVRHEREASFRSDAEDLLRDVFRDQQKLENEIKESIRRDEDRIKTSTRTVLLAADKMAEAGATDIRSVEQWTTIQGELRQSINVIIDAYRRYMRFHHEICHHIENFTRSIIEKYEGELSSIDAMSAPDLVNRTIDANNPHWARYIARFAPMLNYARVHQQTLQTAVDCPGDLMTHALVYRTRIISQPQQVTRTIRIRISQPTVVQESSPNFELPCNDVSEDNGCQGCANAIALATQRFADSACQS